MANDNLNENQKTGRGGKRPGAGRPLHSKNPSTIVREEAKKQFQDRVAVHVDRIFQSQLDLAVGEKYLFVKTHTGTGKDRKTNIDIVTDPDIIRQFLDDELNVNGDDEYYFMTTKPANNMALDSLLNRSFGKAEEKIAIEHSGEIGGIYDESRAGKYAEFLERETKSRE